MLDRMPKGDRVLLLSIEHEHPLTAAMLTEFSELVRATGAQRIAQESIRVRRLHPKTLMGSGHLATLTKQICDHEIELVIVDFTLSPSQERNLERAWQCRVLDRQGLILDIFASRARSLEGQLQVELAQLIHLSTRLVRGWSHLERQKGGIGLRGPGETQLETDRRLIRDRIKRLKARLGKVGNTRNLNRKQRERSGLPNVALVGYTNAGKSTLFNRLTDADVFASNQLFATLDSTSRRIDLPSGRQCVISDTVGFIRDLPHSLVEAFQATLVETQEADLVLLVSDASDVEQAEHIEVVKDVLLSLGVQSSRLLHVDNKMDAVNNTTDIETVIYKAGEPWRVSISAHTGLGINDLLAAIEARLYAGLRSYQLSLPVSGAAMRAELYDQGRVQAEHINDDGSYALTLDLLPAEKAKLEVLLQQCGGALLVSN